MTAKTTVTPQELRQRAEEKFRLDDAKVFQRTSPEETQQLLHDLHLHQIELEMQNEELRRSQEELETSKSRYFDLYDLAPVGYLTISEQGMILEANLAAVTMLGMVRNDLLKKRILRFILPEYLGDYYLLSKRLIETGKLQTLDIRLVRADGSSFWVHLKATPAPNGEFLITFTDITKRKQVEQELLDLRDSLEQRVEERTAELSQSQNMLARTEGIAHIGSWEWDVATDTVTWSDELFRIVGLNPADGAPSFAEHSRIYHPEDMVELKRVVGLTLSAGTQYEVEIRAIRPDGETRICLARGFAERDENGKTTSLFGSLQDITEHKLMEEDLHQAKIAADSANTAKSQFLANMSHELRNPMNGVLGMTQLLEMTELTEEQLEYVTDLNMCGKNLLSLINDILDLSKIEAGKITIEPVEFSLQQCINDVALMQKSAIFGKGLKLDLDVSEDIPQFMMGDQLRVKQILHNLIGNAVKFTSDGGITISAQLLEQQDSSLLVQLAVRDSGIGISPVALDKIFKPFEQEDGSTTRNYGGTGLGLTISRRLAELMGGSITVESTHGAGSCFKVTLPFSVVEESFATQETPQKATVSWEDPALRILLVENDPINITFGTSLLKKLGHEFAVAKNGKECLAALNHGTFDIVLMDINMPDMNGEDALHEIRRNEQDTSLHQMVIALTAYSLRGDKDKFLEEGFDGYVSKPMAVSQLVREMKRVLESRLKVEG